MSELGVIMEMASKLEEIKKIARDGAQTDGEHHKQWALVEIVKLMSTEVEFSEFVKDVEEGIPS